MFNSKKNKIKTINWNCGKEDVDKSKRITVLKNNESFTLKEQEANFLGIWKTVKTHTVSSTSDKVAISIAKEISKRVPGWWYDKNK